MYRRLPPSEFLMLGISQRWRSSVLPLLATQKETLSWCLCNLHDSAFLIYPDPKWRAHGNLQKAPLSWMCCIHVGLAHFHWPAHVHQHPFWSRVQHAEPSAFPVPHLPSGGGHHRGATYKEAHIRSQTLQTAIKPRGHVARPAMAFPGQEPAFHCAYEADTIPPHLLGLTWSRRKVPTRGSQIAGFEPKRRKKNTPHSKEIGVVLLGPQRQDKHLVLFSDTEEPRCQLIAKHCASSLSLCSQRARRRGQGLLVSDCALAYLLSPCWMPEPAGWARPKQQTLDFLYTIDHTHLFRSENSWLHQEQNSPILL